MKRPQESFTLMEHRLYFAWLSFLKVFRCIVSKSHFIKNQARRGGAIYSEDDLKVHDCIFEENSANKGGAIYTEDDLNLKTCIFEENSANEGGAIYTKSSEIGIYIQASFNTWRGNRAGVLT